MRKLIWILFFVAATCCGQNKDFNDYISNFQRVSIPLKINSDNFLELFPGSVWNKQYNINEKYIKDFICCDDSINAYKFVMSDYGYGYGIRWETDNFYIVILRMQRDKGDDAFNFDRLDLILVVYNKFGKYIDRKIISKNNEVWFSNIFVKEKESIYVQQAMMNIRSTSLIDINTVYDATVQDISYEILESGIIKEKFINDWVGKLKWNSEINNFYLDLKK
ncbi:MAG: hypothetical protein ACLSC9_04280 [Barnesiella sp.]